MLCAYSYCGTPLAADHTLTLPRTTNMVVTAGVHTQTLTGHTTEAASNGELTRKSQCLEGQSSNVLYC